MNPLPELTEQVRESALEARYQELETQVRKIYLDVLIDALQLVVPQSTYLKYAFLVDLGRLGIDNEFVSYSLENIRLRLSDVEVKRVVYKCDELRETLKEQVVEKINLSAEVQRLVRLLQVISFFLIAFLRKKRLNNLFWTFLMSKNIFFFLIFFKLFSRIKNSKFVKICK